jgi:FkbM family methyltransferase
LAKYLIRKRYRGGYRLLNLARDWHLLDVCVRYPLERGLQIEVPLYRPENTWDSQDLQGYEAQFTGQLATIVNQIDGPVTLVDCGADIGIFAMKVAAKCPNIQRVIAVEPNPAAYPFLERNLRSLPIKSQAVQAAVSNFRGRGEMQSPAYNPNCGQALYLAPSDDGSVEVTQIDDLGVEPGTPVVIKLDVEGGELNALEGARRMLTNSSCFVVGLEAHPYVAGRTGIDPMVCISYLNNLRACEFLVSENPELRLDLKRPFFQQVPATRVYNVICRQGSPVAISKNADSAASASPADARALA